MKNIKKLDKFDLDNFIKKDKKQKKEYILTESEKIKNIPINIIPDLKKAYKIKEVLNRFITKYIQKIKKLEQIESNQKVLNQINIFKKNYLEITLPKKMNENITNLYSMSGAMDFCKIQLVLRSLSTSMGSLWEKIAMCSNCSINPENEFGVKVTGVDLISLIDNKITYIQMKTMEDTLTAGQSPRSEKELLLHKHSYFAASFDTGRNWNFKSTEVKKVKGEAFWSLINLNYEYILKEVKLMIKEIEDNYYEKKNNEV